VFSITDDRASERRPDGVTVVASIFLLSGIYLAIVGLIMLVFPSRLSLNTIIDLGRPLLDGLEFGGTYTFLIAGWLAIFTGLELFNLTNWARWIATVICLFGVFVLIPIVSIAATQFQISLLWSGLGIMLRVAIVWYLWQEPVKDAFR
jgi:hypothetical protein